MNRNEGKSLHTHTHTSLHTPHRIMSNQVSCFHHNQSGVELINTDHYYSHLTQGINANCPSHQGFRHILLFAACKHTARRASAHHVFPIYNLYVRRPSWFINSLQMFGDSLQHYLFIDPFRNLTLSTIHELKGRTPPLPNSWRSPTLTLKP